MNFEKKSFIDIRNINFCRMFNYGYLTIIVIRYGRFREVVSYRD